MKIINVAESSERMAEVRALFREYATEMGLNLNFQGFEEELADLPGCYEAPRGCILFAEIDGKVAGCIALRPLADVTAEVKRMFVRTECRGKGVALALATELMRQATERGYQRVRLDTLASMVPARRLYETLGFQTIDAYYHNPLADVVYYELVL